MLRVKFAMRVGHIVGEEDMYSSAAGAPGGTQYVYM